MDETAQANSTTAMVVRIVVLIAIWLVYSFGAPYVFDTLGVALWAKPVVGAHSFYKLFIAVGFVGALISVMAMWRCGPRRALQELALTRSAVIGCTVCLVAIAAAVAVLLYAGARYHETAGIELLLFGVLGPFVEEVFFRGLLFRQLRRWAGIPFVYAAILSSLIFGAEHFEQADTFMGSLMNSGVTFAGGFIFCWLVERWNSIWPGFVIHAGLNLAWTLFTLGDNAVGGVMGNVARLAIIVIVVAGTVALTARPKRA